MENSQPKIREKRNLPDFEEFQRKVLGCAGYLAMTRFDIAHHEGKSGIFYTVEKSSPLAQASFYLQTVNSLLKLAYLCHLLLNKYDTINFLDKMALSCYLLIVAQMVILYWIWLPKYPLYEILYRCWKIENDIFRSLGEPRKLKEKVEAQLKTAVWIHSTIAVLGSICFVIQYRDNPKYYLWTYSIIDSDDWILLIVFGAHEFICMFYAWNLMVGANGIFAAQGIVFANMIQHMSARLHALYLKMKDKGSLTRIKVDDTPISKNFAGVRSYEDVDNIIFDYKRMMMISEEYNKCVSYKTVYLHIIGYCQFIADCFVVFQVLKLPGTGIWDVWFFVEDCCASSFLIYRVYELLSKVEPASRGFHQEMTYYIKNMNSSGERKRLQKTMKTLKLISLKLGPCPVNRQTVLNAMDTLANYYICVAFWS